MNDPGFVNGYLILDSRSTNLISKLVAEEYLGRSAVNVADI
jgi:hypothetical protein